MRRAVGQLAVSVWPTSLTGLATDSTVSSRHSCHDSLDQSLMSDGASDGHFCRTVHAHLDCSRADCGYCSAYLTHDVDADDDSTDADTDADADAT